jgi:hypothetical protein
LSFGPARFRYRDAADFEPPDEVFEVVLPAGKGQFHGVAFGELANRCGQHLRRRQDSVFDQHGDDDSFRVQGELDLAAHVIQRVVEAPRSVVPPQV